MFESRCEGLGEERCQQSRAETLRWEKASVGGVCGEGSDQGDEFGEAAKASPCGTLQAMGLVCSHFYGHDGQSLGGCLSKGVT